MMNKLPILILSLCFSSAVYADCNQAKSYYKQAVTSKNNKDYKQALADIDKAIELCQKYASYYEQGRILAKLNKLDQALESFKNARNLSISASPREANALARSALIYFKKGALQKSSLFIEQAYAINKQNSSEWLLRVRKKIDLQSAQHISSADEIQTAISISEKSFGVVPKLKFNSITFKFNSTELTEAGRRQVAELGKFLANQKQTVLLTGHTDKVGDSDYNMQLSLRRAQAVKQTLQKTNPQLTGHIQTQGKGEQELRYSGDDASDHQLNRRVDMEVL